MRILTIGDNNIDTYTSGYSYAGGNCVNVSAYAAMNGWDATYCGVIGTDEFGDLQVRALQAVGVNTSMLRRATGKTSRDIIVSRNGERVFTCYDRSIIDANPLSFSTAELNMISHFDLLHSSVYSSFAPGAFAALCNCGIPISFDFSVEWKRGASQVEGMDYDTIMRNLQENTMELVCPQIDFAFLSCSDVSLDEMKAALETAVSLGCRLAVGTRGMEGSWCFDGRQFYHQPAYPSRAVDTLGAGDSFITRFLITYLEKMAYLQKVRAAVGHTLSSSSAEDYLEKVIPCALADGALFASRTCSLEGAFGFGEKL